MTPVIIMEPGEKRLVRMIFDQYEEIAWQGDSLKGVPTATVTPASANTGTASAGTGSLYPATGQATEARFVMDCTSAADGDSYTVKVTCGTAGGSTLVAVGLLQIKAQP